MDHRLGTLGRVGGLAGVLALIACGTDGSTNPADGGWRRDTGSYDAQVWWYDCFPAGSTLCARDWPIPPGHHGLATPVWSQWTTPLLAVDETPFVVSDTQSTGDATAVPRMLEGTWGAAEPLAAPHPWEYRARPPVTTLTFDTAAVGRWTLAIAIPAADLAFVPTGEAITVTLFEGIAIHRAADGALLMRLADRLGWDFAEGHPAPPSAETLTGSDLVLAVVTPPTCFGAEGTASGNRQYGLDGLRVTGDAAPVVLEPGDEATVDTTAGTYRVQHLAGWHRAFEVESTCASFADLNPWRLSYEVVRVE